jgi:dihydrodipicolinate synthase/N-acetylneuraminate lyase
MYSRARAAGATGVVSGIASAVPELMAAIDRAVRAGNAARTARLDARIQEFIDQLSRLPFPVAIREAAALRGQRPGPHAIPLGAGGSKQLEEFGTWFRAWLPAVQRECSDA